MPMRAKDVGSDPGENAVSDDAVPGNEPVCRVASSANGALGDPRAAEADARVPEAGEVSPGEAISVENLPVCDATYLAFLQHAPFGVTLNTLHGEFAEVNELLLQTAGMTREEVLGKTPVELGFVTPEESAGALEQLVRNGGKLDCLEMRVWGRLAREWRYLQVSTTMIQIGGEPRILSIYNDITDRKRAEAALAESEAKFRDLAERSSDLLYRIDFEGSVVYVSPAVERILGYRPEEVVARHFLEFMAQEDRPIVGRFLTNQVADRDPPISVCHMVRKDGTRAILEGSAVRIPMGDGTMGVQGVLRDVTARCEAEERLRASEWKLAHLARLTTMGEMVAAIAHELHHPLYTIQNLAQACRNVLQNGVPLESGELCAWCEQISAAASQAGAIMRSLRGFSRKIEPLHTPVSLHAILEESVKLVTYEACRCRAVVTLDLDKTSPIVNVDRIQIQQVLVNLLRNACDAVGVEGVARRSVVVQSRACGDVATVAVIDTGIGLPPNEPFQGFQPFFTTKADGLGLGLSICVAILEAHDGRIDAFSNPEGGATFRITLPAVPPNQLFAPDAGP